MTTIRLKVGGNLRIIRRVMANTDTEFEAFYRGCQIIIVEMGECDEHSPQRFLLNVRAPDGGLIVDTWEYARDFSREALLVKALTNILLT